MHVDFDQNPFVVIWEMTRACDLACVHCRAAAQSRRSQFELPTLAIEPARDNNIPVQINSTVSKRTAADMPRMAELLSRYENIVMWSVFFLVPTGRAKTGDMIEAEEVEQLFGSLYEISKNARFNVRTTEAMHYRRYVLQRSLAEQGKSVDALIDPMTGLVDASTVFMGAMGKLPLGVQMQSGAITRAPRGVNEAKGFVFISHIGDVFPSGFLPLRAGNVKKE